MRICFKMRKFFFPIQDYVVHLQRKQKEMNKFVYTIIAIVALTGVVDGFVAGWQ